MTAQPPAAQPVSPSPKMELGAYISKAWNLVTKDLLLFIVSYLIVVLLASIPLVNIIIGGPLMFGFLRIVQKRYKGEPAQIGQVFDAFKTDFAKGLVTFLLMFVAGLCLFIPVIIVVIILSFIPVCGALLAVVLYIAAIIALMSGLYFVMPIAALSDVQPFDAIKQGLKFLGANVGSMVLLALVTCLISGAGVIACGIGVLFTAPLAFAIMVVAYNEYYLPNAPAA
jgi:hypothetical protein